MPTPVPMQKQRLGEGVRKPGLLHGCYMGL